MRFFVGRLLKKIHIINTIWQSFIDFIDFKYYKKHCNGYKIIPFGNYCLPRLITTINRFKPTKRYGEETFPFDLCFSNFSYNTQLLETNFDNFYIKTVFDEDKKYLINKELGLVFMHDDTQISVFKEKYDKRINNLYNVLHNRKLHIYFIVATFDIISEETIERFINVINRYRGINTYDLIIINQAKEKITSKYENVYIIDLTKDDSFEKINKKGYWGGELKWLKSIDARNFNNKIKSELSKIIKQQHV